MSKRKILSLAMALSIVAIMAVGATLAYFTDTDEATNTFTVGNVNITLIEQERNADGTALQDFTADKPLFPIVGSAQGEKDKFGLPTAENYADKIVTVKVEEGSQDAYVRLYYAIPAALDTPNDAQQNILHFNVGNKFVAAGTKTAKNADVETEAYKNYMGGETNIAGEYTIDDVKYHVYYRDYNKVLKATDVTEAAFITGVYLDKAVDYNGTNYTINNKVIDFDFTAGVKVPVVAVGVQAAGFDTCDAAMDAAFGADYNPWAN